MRLRRTSRLTVTQWPQAAEIFNEWSAYALSIAPADRPAAERAIARLYKLHGTTAPPIVWTESPVTAILTAWSLATAQAELPAHTPLRELPDTGRWAGVNERFRDSVRRSLAEAFGSDATLDSWCQHRSQPGWRHIGDRLSQRFRDVPAISPWEAIWHRLAARRGRPWCDGERRRGRGLDQALQARANLKLRSWVIREIVRGYGRELPFASRWAVQAAWTPLFYELRPALEEQLLPEDVRGHFIQETDDSFARWSSNGQFDADWVGRYDAIARLGLVRYPRKQAEVLDAHVAIARSCGFWWPRGDVCVVAERPTRLDVEPCMGGFRPHRADGPAIIYADGWQLFAWHGTPMPRRAYEGDLTIADWLNVLDVEVRRAIADLRGYEWLLDKGGATRIADDDFGTLWRIPDPYDDEEDIVLVDVVNSTPKPDGTIKRNILRVPPDQTAPRDAIGWTFDLSPGEYAPDRMT